MTDEQNEKGEGESAEVDEVLQDIAEGAAKILENAADLRREALLLHDAGALSRSLTLHQISLEECSKIDMLGAWTSGRLMGYQQPELQQLSKPFAGHRAKNHTNAYMIPPAKAEAAAREKGDWEEALNAFKAMQAEFHAESNSAKNASLYVDLREGRFVAPKERITAEIVDRIAARNEEFLGRAQLTVRMLYRWAKNPGVVKSLFSWFEPRLREMRAAEDDPGDAAATILEELLERARSMGYPESMMGRREPDD